MCMLGHCHHGKRCEDTCSECDKEMGKVKIRIPKSDKPVMPLHRVGKVVLPRHDLCAGAKIVTKTKNVFSKKIQERVEVSIAPQPNNDKRRIVEVESIWNVLGIDEKQKREEFVRLMKMLPDEVVLIVIGYSQALDLVNNLMGVSKRFERLVMDKDIKKRIKSRVNTLFISGDLKYHLYTLKGCRRLQKAEKKKKKNHWGKDYYYREKPVVSGEFEYEIENALFLNGISLDVFSNVGNSIDEFCTLFIDKQLELRDFEIPEVKKKKKKKLFGFQSLVNEDDLVLPKKMNAKSKQLNKVQSYEESLSIKKYFKLVPVSGSSISNRIQQLKKKIPSSLLRRKNMGLIDTNNRITYKFLEGYINLMERTLTFRVVEIEEEEKELIVPRVRAPSRL